MKRRMMKITSFTAAIQIFSVVIVIHSLTPAGLAMQFGSSYGDDVMHSTCPPVNKYLQSYCTCRRSEFSRQVSCDESRLEIRCPRTKYIAIHSASYGWSERMATDCSGAGRTTDSSDETDCPRTCAVDYVTGLCHGKRTCSIDVYKDAASKDYISMAARRQRCQTQKTGSPQCLGILYTCVKKSLLRHIESNEGFVDPCEETDEGGRGGPEEEEGRRSQVASSPTTTTGTAAARLPASPPFSASTPSTGLTDFGHNLRVKTDTPNEPFPQRPMPEEQKGRESTPVRSLRNDLLSTSSGSNERARMLPTATPGVQVRQTATDRVSPFWIHSFSDWLWTWHFISGNTEKFVLYMLLGFSLGTIAILVAVLFHLALCPRRRGLRAGGKGEAGMSSAGPAALQLQATIISSCNNSPTWRMPESESSTGDDRTLHDDDVELTSFNHIDSLQRRTSYLQQQQQQQQQQGGLGVGRPPSAMGGLLSPPPLPAGLAAAPATTTATINRSYSQVNPTATRCFTPSPPSMTLPPPACTSSAAAAANGVYAGQYMMGNGRLSTSLMGVVQPPPTCAGSLPRTYPNQHYRRDSYQLDPAPGCRTLQPIQNYYG